jgi:CheY-like chemotaxis protein
MSDGLTILIAEDDDGHALLIRERLERVGVSNPVRRFKDGAEAWELTTTDDPREIENCYKLGCNSYLTKPVEFEKFAEVIKRLGLFLMVIRVDKYR